MEEFTNTQMAILRILADGMRHSRDDLVEVLPGENSDYRTLSVHLSKMRKMLRPIGQDIICELSDRKIHYRHIRLLCGGDPVPLAVKLAALNISNAKC